jgi:dephospho-CoA kinase
VNAAAGAGASLERSAARFVPQDEPVILAVRPHIFFVLLYHPWRIVLPVLALIIVLAASRAGAVGGWADELSMVVLLWLAAIVWQVLSWLSRLYVLTRTRLIVVAGIIARDIGDVPLRNIQHATVIQSIFERLLGLGTLGVATAGSDGPAIRWLMVADPDRLLASIRHAADDARGSTGRSAPGAAGAPPAAGNIPVIGLAGGIGAGKSIVAAALGDLGCVVIDSDAQAKTVLERPEVRDELVRWWGRGVMGADGGIDRKAVAKIVFADERERKRLEALVHPLVRVKRAELARAARDSGAAAVVVDAPLLFEAGVDAECDAVIFVDAPREIRLARVRARSGWDDAELERREKSQWPLESKRARSDFVVVNDGPPDVLAARVASVLDQILRGRARGGVTGS